MAKKVQETGRKQRKAMAGLKLLYFVSGVFVAAVLNACMTGNACNWYMLRNRRANMGRKKAMAGIQSLVMRKRTNYSFGENKQKFLNGIEL